MMDLDAFARDFGSHRRQPAEAPDDSEATPAALPVGFIDAAHKAIDELNTLSRLLAADRDHGLLGLPWMLDQIANDLLDAIRQQEGVERD